MLRNARTAAASLVLAALAACSPPKAPEEERRPEPQAAAQEQSALTEYADSYKDRARAVETQQQEASDRQRAQLDAATR